MKRVVVNSLLLFSCFCLLMSSFSYSQDQDRSSHFSYDFTNDFLKNYYSQLTGISVHEICNTFLYGAIESWLGVPYRYAGRSRKGIDCSAFVSVVYNNAFDSQVQGNSYTMYQNSKPVKKNDLEEGDLVFFKTSRHKTISHVGVFLGNNKFAHASRTNGVIISDLQNSYYKKRFVRGGRLISLRN